MTKAEKNPSYTEWMKKIKAGNVKDVLSGTKGKDIDSKLSLECIVKISQCAYDDVVKGVPYGCPPEEVFLLTEKFCSMVTPDPLITVRYLTSLYHILNFLFEKDGFVEITKLFQRVVQFKKNNLKAFEEEGKNLHQPFLCLLKKSIVKAVSKKTSFEDFTPKIVSDLFGSILSLLETNGVMRNGTCFLQVILEACQIVGKEDPKTAVLLITSGLKMFYEINKIVDCESLISLLFKIYTCLFSFQLKLSSFSSALISVDGHLNLVKRKISENGVHGDCFLLLCNATKILMWNRSESSVLNKVQVVNRLLKSFQKSADDTFINSACVLFCNFLTNSLKAKKKDLKVLGKVCMKAFLEMILNIHDYLNNSKTDRGLLHECLGHVFLYIVDADIQNNLTMMTDCLEIILETETRLFTLLSEMRAANDVNFNICIKLTLIRIANLIGAYHMAGLSNKVTSISKPACKFISTLPSEILKDDKIQRTAEICFMSLASNLAEEHLDKGLECIVAWLFKCPHAAKNAFKRWGDLKHNTVCKGKEDYLDSTVYTIITENKKSLESEWLPCPWNDAEIGTFLFHELKTYSVTKVLRGKPVICAVDTLLALPIDCLLQAKGLVIGMDIVSANNSFSEKCLAYLSKSKFLISKLRKDKKSFNPVDFNLCMGDLLYAQLRCHIRLLRADCEAEVIRLTIAPRQPLVAELPESRPDPDDTCDVSTKYNNICLAKQRKIMQDMECAFRHWGFACSLIKEMSKTDYDMTTTLCNLKDAGYLLRLYCDENKEVTAWKLLYNMATLVKDIDMILTAVGELLSINEEIDQEWVEDAEKLIKSPEISPESKFFELNQASYKLINNMIVEGLDLLKKIESIERKGHIELTKLYILIGQYQEISDWNKYKKNLHSSPSYHFSYHKALAYLLYLAEDRKWKNFTEICQIHFQLLHVSRLLGEANWVLEQPREARCYLRTQLSLAQKLALPLRTVQLLLLLAWVDFHTGLMDDCAVKIEGLEDLLELCGTPIIYGHSDSSPTLSRSVLSEPEFLRHAPRCNCLHCETLEYRRLVLETVTLRASYCAAFGQVDESLQSFKVARSIQENLSQSQNKTVLVSCARMFIHYANVMAFMNKFQEALTANTKALELIYLSKNPIILQHAIEQKSTIQLRLLQVHFIPITDKFMETEKTPVKTLTPVKDFKTPKNKPAPGNTPLSSIDNNVVPITPFARPVKHLKITSSDDENTPPNLNPKTKRKGKINLPKFITETPQTIKIPKNSSKAPFVIMDDDENTQLDYKTANTRKKTKNISDTTKSPKKTLFPYDNDVKGAGTTPENVLNGNIVRKSNRKVELNKHRNTGIASKTSSSFASEISRQKNEGDNSKTKDAFSFNQMRKVINNIHNDIEEAKTSKGTDSTLFSSSFPLTNKNSKKNTVSNLAFQVEDSKTRNITTKTSSTINDSDCCDDIIEGTPSPKKKILTRQKRTRPTQGNN